MSYPPINFNHLLLSFLSSKAYFLNCMFLLKSFALLLYILDVLKFPFLHRIYYLLVVRKKLFNSQAISLASHFKLTWNLYIIVSFLELAPFFFFFFLP